MNKITQLRKEAKLNQSDLAKYLGCSTMAISNYENGNRKIPPDVLDKLCTAFNCSADYLLGRSEIKSPAAQSSEANGVSASTPPSMHEDQFRRIQEANNLFLKLDEAGKAQAIAYLQFLAAQQATDPDAQN